MSDMAKLSIWAVVVSETDWERVDMNKPDCLTADLSKTFFFRVLSAVHQTSSPRHALSVGILDLLLDPQTGMLNDELSKYVVALLYFLFTPTKLLEEIIRQLPAPFV